MLAVAVPFHVVVWGGCPPTLTPGYVSSGAAGTVQFQPHGVKIIYLHTMATDSSSSSAASAARHPRDAPRARLPLSRITPFRAIVLQDMAILTLVGAALLLAPNWAAAASAPFVKAPLVIKSDTSYLLARCIGATQIAFAAGVLARHYVNDHLDAGWSLAAFHVCMAALLSVAAAAGGPTARALLPPFIAHDAATAAALAYVLPSPARKAVARLLSARAGDI